MSKNNPVFFDNTGKRQKIVDFILLILMFVVVIVGFGIFYYTRPISKIEQNVYHTQELPSNNSVTVLYTETNSGSYTVLGDQIQNIHNIIVPKYFVSNLGISIPLSYEKLNKSVLQQSKNANIAYNTYYLLSSQNFALQPIERNFSTPADVTLPTLLVNDLSKEIVASISSENASGLFINLDLKNIKTTKDVQIYTDWLNKVKSSLNGKGLHLGLMVDPAEINATNKNLLSIAEQLYLGQSKTTLEKQILGLKNLDGTKISNLTIELPTTSTKTDTRDNSKSTINVDYRSVDDLLLNKQVNRTDHSITIKDNPFVFNIFDAVSDYNYMKDVKNIIKEPKIEFAISDPGFEEYTLWKTVNNNISDKDTIRILSEETASGLVINEQGNGQVYNLKQEASPGERKLTFNNKQEIESSELTKLDTVNEVVKQGEGTKKVALTFDDGPNPVYTPKVMDILESYGVRGTFFATGQNVLAYPETARAIVNRGHKLENHTFNHPVFNELTAQAKRSQIEQTNKVIQEITGTKPQFFRMPYSDRNEASSTSDVAYLALLKELGLKASEYEIDSKDWQLSSSDQIVQRVKQEFEASNGHYSEVLLHDAHENEELTLEALPKIIEYIKSQGIEIVTVDKLVDEPADNTSKASSNTYRALIVQRGIVKVATIISIIFIILSLIRYIWMFVGSLFYRIKRSLLKFLCLNLNLNTKLLPRIDIIIACYNEAKVIGKTIEAMQQNSYQNYKLILVNDGSTDKTAQIIKGYADKDKRIKLISIANGGKAKALEKGLSASKNKWIVFCDADTIFASNALYEFAHTATIDRRLSAVAGKILVGNDINFLTRAQLIEYEIAYRFVKSAQDVTNMITVVPGAAGLWNRNNLVKAGGFMSDTLAEDADTTMRVISNGGRVGYRAKILARTEAPEKLKMLFKQRTRWQLGNMQSIYKHRKGLFSFKYGTLGVVGLPMFFIDLLAAVTYPFILVFTVFMVFGQGYGSIDKLKVILVHPLSDITVFLGLILIIVEVLLVLYVVLSAKVPLWRKVKLVVTIPFYVLVYKMYLSLFTLIALLRALKGRMHGWGYQNRTSSVSINN